jgi:hypothetical protein
MRRYAGGSPEGHAEVMRTQARQCRQVSQSNVLGEVRFDIVGDALQVQHAESSDRGWCPSETITIGTEGAYDERRTQPLEPTTHTAFDQFPAPRYCHALGDWIADAGLESKRRFLPIEGLAYDLLDEGLSYRYDENSRRTHPALKDRPVAGDDMEIAGYGKVAKATHPASANVPKATIVVRVAAPTETLVRSASVPA